MKKLISLLLVLALVSSTAFALAAKEPTVLEQFDFTCKTVDNGTFTLSEHLGEVVLLNFWATWCGPCVYELPGLAELAEKYADAEDVTIMTVESGDRRDVVERFLKDKKLTLPVACDENDRVIMRYGFDSIPVTILFNKDGSPYGAWIGLQADVDEVCQHYSEMIEAIR